MTRATPTLSIADLSVTIKTEGVTISPVRGVSVDLSQGETLGIAGESGCGKSMTMMAVMDLLPRGAVRKASRLTFSGRSLLTMGRAELDDIRGSEIAMIFQDPTTCLNPVLPIGRQLEEVYLRHRPGTRHVARDRAVELLTKVGITAAADRLRQFPHQLSGGLRQRIMIAMALMCEPRLIIADEPTTALDVTVQAEILRLLKSLQAEMGLSLILVSHDLGVLASVCDRIAVMYAGRIVEIGSVSDVLDAPGHPYTQALLKCQPKMDSARQKANLDTIVGLPPQLDGDLAGCQFRFRCAYAFGECGRTDPRMQAIGSNGHKAACLLSTGSATPESAR